MSSNFNSFYKVRFEFCFNKVYSLKSVLYVFNMNLTFQDSQIKSQYYLHYLLLGIQM